MLNCDDNEIFSMEAKDDLYLGKGTKKVEIQSGFTALGKNDEGLGLVKNWPLGKKPLASKWFAAAATYIAAGEAGRAQGRKRDEKKLTP